MIVTRCLLLFIFVIGNILISIYCEDNINSNKENTTSNISTSFENGTIENVTKIYPSYINQLIIAGSGYNENSLKEMEIEEKLEKIILISIQLSLSNHLSRKSISNEFIDFKKTEFYWNFETATESDIYDVNMSQTNLITEKNTIKVNITGMAVKMGNTFLYFIVQYKNRTVHSDIVSEELSMLTLSHISAFLGLPVIEINSMLNIGQRKNDGNNWWIIILMFASGLILFFMCWCMLFIYFNTCGQLTYRYTHNTTSTVNNTNDKTPNTKVPLKETPVLKSELKEINKKDSETLQSITKVNDKKSIMMKSKNKDISKINLFTNASYESSTTTSINSSTVMENEISSDNETNDSFKKTDTDRSTKKNHSYYDSSKSEFEEMDPQFNDEKLSSSKLQKNKEGRKRPLSAKIRSPAFKDVNEFKSILNEEKVILKPEMLVNDEWNPYHSGDYIAKHFVRSMDPQFYPSPKNVKRDEL